MISVFKWILILLLAGMYIKNNLYANTTNIGPVAWKLLYEETFDEYFPYSEKEFPPQGFWNIYGLGLPDSVLRRVYHENAMQIIPGLREKFANAITQDS